MPRDSDFKKGTEDAVYFWLEQHPISLGDAFREAVEKAVEKAAYEWLCHNEEEVLHAIRRAVRLPEAEK